MQNEEQKTVEVKPSIKKKPAPKPASPQVQALIDSGIPIRFAIFHRAIRSHMGEPETGMWDPSCDKATKISRVGKMWYTPHGLVIDQGGKFKIIPLANVSDTDVL